MWRAAFVGVFLAAGCGQVVDPASSKGDAAPFGSSSGGALGFRDAGASQATGGRPLTEEEAVCNGGPYPLAPADADARSCDYILPSALERFTRRIQVIFSASGLDIAVPFLNQAGDCVLNRDQGWLLDHSHTPPTIGLCPESCAEALSGAYVLSAGCAQHSL